MVITIFELGMTVNANQVQKNVILRIGIHLNPILFLSIISKIYKSISFGRFYCNRIVILSPNEVNQTKAYFNFRFLIEIITSAW